VENHISTAIGERRIGFARDKPGTCKIEFCDVLREFAERVGIFASFLRYSGILVRFSVR
jgi:hypothetical protein